MNLQEIETEQTNRIAADNRMYFDRLVLHRWTLSLLFFRFCYNNKIIKFRLRNEDKGTTVKAGITEGSWHFMLQRGAFLCAQKT